MSWEDAWREGRTGWDAGASPPALVELARSGDLPSGRALVPGCGAGYDVLTLAHAGLAATGLEVAPTAAERFEALRDDAGLDPSVARVELGDFFTYAPAAPFDLMWDYTFLCAIEPARRPAWEARAHTLLADDGELVTLIFPARPEPLNGPGRPPYPLLPEDVEALLSPRWERVELRPVTRSHAGRDGLEHLGRWRKRA